MIKGTRETGIKKKDMKVLTIFQQTQYPQMKKTIQLMPQKDFAKQNIPISRRLCN